MYGYLSFIIIYIYIFGIFVLTRNQF